MRALAASDFCDSGAASKNGGIHDGSAEFLSACSSVLSTTLSQLVVTDSADEDEEEKGGGGGVTKARSVLFLHSFLPSISKIDPPLPPSTLDAIVAVILSGEVDRGVDEGRSDIFKRLLGGAGFDQITQVMFCPRVRSTELTSKP
jgi:hypothetical protein